MKGEELTRKRSREEMVAGVLKMASEPDATVSSITQMVGLPWGSWVAIKKDLTKRGLLLKVDGHWRTTEKGLEWLRLRERMAGI